MDGCVIAVYVDSQITFEALPIAHILPYIMTTIVDDKVVQIPMKIIETGKLNFGLNIRSITVANISLRYADLRNTN